MVASFLELIDIDSGEVRDTPTATRDRKDRRDAMAGMNIDELGFGPPY